jgi:hypothetical protein
MFRCKKQVHSACSWLIDIETFWILSRICRFETHVRMWLIFSCAKTTVATSHHTYTSNAHFWTFSKSYVGSSNEASIPAGLSGTVTLDWNSSTGPSPYQFASPPREITSLISRPYIASGFYPSPVPSLLSTVTSNSSPPAIFLSSSSISQMSTHNQLLPGRSRARSKDSSLAWSPPVSPVMRRGRPRTSQKKKCKSKEVAEDAICVELAKNARKENDALVYLDGPRIYTCGECRTHLTSHDEIISKSFHGRHGEFVGWNFGDSFPFFLL